MTLRGAILGLLLAVTAGMSLFLLGPDSDGAISSFDGVLYGMNLERHPIEGISGHHPLFHALGIPLTAALRALGVATPGHVAIRILSGTAACVIVLLVFRAAGRVRWAVGAGFACLLLVTRGFVIDAAIGESILPGCAAALWVLVEATREPPRPARLAVALVLALLLRQDNILFVPGVIAALAWGLPRGGRLVPSLAVLGGAGLVTLGAYAGCWWLTARDTQTLPMFLTYLSRMGWTTQVIGLGSAAMHLDALSAAVTGRNWPREDLHLFLGAGFVVAMAAAGLLLQSTTPRPRVTVAVALTLAVRAVFFTWFDPWNPEWSIVTLALVAFWGPRVAAGEPRFPAAVRRTGAFILAALAAFALWSHASFTSRLRERHLIEAAAHATAEGRGCRFISYGWHIAQALEYLGVESLVLADDEPADKTLARIREEFAREPVPTMVVMDRWVISDDPWAVANARSRGSFLDGVSLPAGVRLLRHEGLAFAAQWTPPAAESRR